jgi:hypothetical protein
LLKSKRSCITGYVRYTGSRSMYSGRSAAPRVCTAIGCAKSRGGCLAPQRPSHNSDSPASFSLPSMMQFGMAALRTMAISPVVARECKSLARSIVQVLHKCTSMRVAEWYSRDGYEHAETDDECAARADELLAEGLRALGFLTLHDSKAVVAAGAIPVAVEVLQGAGSDMRFQRGAWEQAAHLLCFLDVDPNAKRQTRSGTHADSVNLLPPRVPYLRACK